MRGTRASTGQVRLRRNYGIYDHRIDEGIDGLISVVGVKYTTHRDVGRKTIDLVFKKLGKKPPRCVTEERPIYGGEIERFGDYLSMAIQESGLNRKVTHHLVHNYGSKYRDILKYGDTDPSLLETVDGSEEVIKAEILNGLQNEMALKLSDVVLRRTDLGTAGNPGQRTLRSVAQIMADELGWNKARMQQEVEETMALYVPAD